MYTIMMDAATPRFARVVVIFLSMLGGIDQAVAQLEWNGSQSDSWFNGLNWTPAGPPGSSDPVIIDVISPNSTVIALADAGSAGVIVGSLSSGRLEIHNGRTLTSTSLCVLGEQSGALGSVVVNGPASTWDLGNHTLTVGSSGNGWLEVINAGSVQAGFVGLGNLAGSQGAMALTGSASSLTHSANIVVGQAGSGALSVTEGAQVTSGSFGFIGPAGVVTVAGANSAWDVVGGLRLGGLMTIEDQGTVTDDEAIIAPFAGSHGEMTVTGAGSQWLNATSLVIGGEGSGVLTIEDGGTVVNNHDSVIADESDAQGVVSVTGAGSTWSTGFTVVGGAGDGSVTIESDATVVSAGGVVGFAFTAAGSVSVNGAGASWNLANTLIIGSQGTASGTLDVTDGAAVNTGNWVIIGNDGGAVGHVTLAGAGSSWSIGGDLQVGRFGAGSLDIGAGAAVDVADTVRVPGETAVNSHGALVVNGELAAAGIVTVDTPGVLGGGGLIDADVTVYGVIAPSHFAGNPVGTLTITGDLELQPTAILEFDLDGPGDPGDQLNVSGGLVLDGMLQITDLGGIGPGEYLLIQYDGMLTEHNPVVSGLPAGLTAVLDTTLSGRVLLVVDALSDPIFADRFEN